MAKIDVYTADLHDLSAKLKKAEHSLSEVQSLVASVQSGLSMKVAARENIDGRLSAVKAKLVRQNAKVGKMASLSTVAAQEFADADKGVGQKAQGIFNAVLGGLSSLANAVGHFLSSIVVQHHGAIAGIFLGGGSLLLHSSLGALGGLFGSQGSSGGSQGSSVGGHSSGGGRHDGAASGENSKPPMQAEESVKPVEEPHVTTEEEKQQMLKEINDRYQRLPRAKEGFSGKCGAFVYQQLNEMGVVVGGESTNYGKDYAKVLAQKGRTATGYTCTGYEGNDAFDKLLEANKGKFPITNIVCSFNPGGNFTDKKAGHAMLISKIDANGNVYFMDNTKMSNEKAVCLTLAEFKAFYFKAGNVCNGITHLYK